MAANAFPDPADCPICGGPTDPIHIAGDVYDYVCGQCCTDTDAALRGAVQQFLRKIAPLPPDPSIP